MPRPCLVHVIHSIHVYTVSANHGHLPMDMSMDSQPLHTPTPIPTPSADAILFAIPDQHAHLMPHSPPRC